MAEPPATNGYGDRSPAKQPANRTVQGVDRPPLVATSRRKRSRTASTTNPLTVSSAIPVKNEARNIAWVLEQIADDVSEVILVDGNSTDATLTTARSCRPTHGIRAQLLQSDEEWAARNAILSRHLANLINEYTAPGAIDGIEVGCQHGALTEQMKRLTQVPNWTGIDPALTGETVTDRGCTLRRARASRLEFPDGMFDVAVFANVFEHIPPGERDASLREIYRVLKSGGVVVGQLPNPYFPIESHSRLPFMGWLPDKWQHRYWKLAPVSWEHDFYVVTIKHLKQAAQRAGFDVVHVRNFNYPPEAIPSGVRWAARLLERPMRYMPWSWQFVLVRPA